MTCDRMRCVEVAIVRLAEGCRYNKRHRSHASGSACGALETGYSVPEDRVLLEQDIAQWYESLNGARETGWHGHATSMRPARPAPPCTLNFNMGACEVRMASEFQKSAKPDWPNSDWHQVGRAAVHISGSLGQLCDAGKRSPPLSSWHRSTGWAC